MEKLQKGYYTIDKLSEALGIQGDILIPAKDGKLAKVISREEQAIAEIKAWGYQFLYFKDNIGTFPPTPRFKDRSRSFVVIVTVPKNLKYSKDRKYSVKDPLTITDAKLDFLKESIITYETKTTKYNCRKIHSERMSIFTRQGYFAKEFYDAVAAFKDDILLAIEENKVTLEESKSKEMINNISEALDYNQEIYRRV